jgi:hypothetical protein
MRVDIVVLNNGVEFYFANRALTEQFLGNVNPDLIRSDIHNHLVINSLEDVQEAVNEMSAYSFNQESTMGDPRSPEFVPEVTPEHVPETTPADVGGKPSNENQ